MSCCDNNAFRLLRQMLSPRSIRSCICSCRHYRFPPFSHQLVWCANERQQKQVWDVVLVLGVELVQSAPQRGSCTHPPNIPCRHTRHTVRGVLKYCSYKIMRASICSDLFTHTLLWYVSGKSVYCVKCMQLDL